MMYPYTGVLNFRRNCVSYDATQLKSIGRNLHTVHKYLCHSQVLTQWYHHSLEQTLANYGPWATSACGLPNAGAKSGKG